MPSPVRLAAPPTWCGQRLCNLRNWWVVGPQFLVDLLSVVHHWIFLALILIYPMLCPSHKEQEGQVLSRSRNEKRKAIEPECSEVTDDGPAHREAGRCLVGIHKLHESLVCKF